MKLSTNEVALMGFVGGDAQAEETKNHNKYVVVSLATTDSWKGKDGAWQKGRAWPRLVGWSATGDSMIRNLTKGPSFRCVDRSATTKSPHGRQRDSHSNRDRRDRLRQAGPRPAR